MILITGAAGASGSAVIREFAGDDILYGRSPVSTISTAAMAVPKLRKKTP